MPSITTIIPVWNRARQVGKAIDSALAQQLPAGDWTHDIIIADDGSTDQLTLALAPYGPKVIHLRSDTNRGAAAARNMAIEAARGDYVAFLDSDDEWLPGKLVSQIAFMQTESHPASCTAFFLLRPDGNEVLSPQYRTGALTDSDLVWGCFVSPGSTLMCKRSIFGEIGLLDTMLQRLEDWDWLLRYSARNSLGFLAQPLARIEMSQFVNADAIIGALSLIENKQSAGLSPGNRRRFRAALALQRAAARFRNGAWLSGAVSLLASLLRSPFRNPAIAAILHNRFARH